MAYIGLRKPFVAKRNPSTGAYSDGFQYSHAVSMNVTPNFVEASLYGDDEPVEYEKSFKDADVSLGTTSTPAEAADVVFGHTVSEGKVIYKATDSPNQVGIGVTAPEVVDGEKKFVAMIIVNTKFADPADTLTTKGENLQFGTPTISGKASTNENGEWKITKTFDTEAAAISFVKEYLNIE